MGGSINPLSDFIPNLKRDSRRQVGVVCLSLQGECEKLFTLNTSVSAKVRRLNWLLTSLHRRGWRRESSHRLESKKLIVLPVHFVDLTPQLLWHVDFP